MKSSWSINILRLGLLLVFIGLFAPISCKSNGYEIAQGIFGNSEQLKNMPFLSSIENFYGYLLLGVFAFALLGLILTFLKMKDNSLFLGFACLVTSLFLFLIIGYRFKIHFNSKEFTFYIISGGMPITVKLLIGWFSMVAGYIIGTIGFILKILKKID